jgi:hypothetical protein
MIGKKKLSTLREEIRDAFSRAGTDPEQWFGRQIRKLERRPDCGQGEIETLRMLCAALADAVKAAPMKTRRRMNNR